MSAWKKIKVIVIASSVALAFGFVAAGCGGSDTSSTTPTTPTSNAGATGTQATGTQATGAQPGVQQDPSVGRRHAKERIEKRNQRYQQKQQR